MLDRQMDYMGEAKAKSITQMGKLSVSLKCWMVESVVSTIHSPGEISIIWQRANLPTQTLLLFFPGEPAGPSRQYPKVPSLWDTQGYPFQAGPDLVTPLPLILAGV